MSGALDPEAIRRIAELAIRYYDRECLANDLGVDRASRSARRQRAVEYVAAHEAIEAIRAASAGRPVPAEISPGAAFARSGSSRPDVVEPDNQRE